MSSYSANPACHSARNTPAFSHSRNRLWIVLALPNRSRGSAFHWQPVRNTYTIASNTTRGSFGLRPPPGLRTNFRLPDRGVGCGISGSTRSQNASETTHDSSLALAIAFLRRPHLWVRKESVLLYLRISSKSNVRRKSRSCLSLAQRATSRRQLRKRQRPYPRKRVAFAAHRNGVCCNRHRELQATHLFFKPAGLRAPCIAKAPLGCAFAGRLACAQVPARLPGRLSAWHHHA